MIEGVQAIVLYCESPDGDMGYPGNLAVKVIFRVCEAQLEIRYYAISDQDTVLNLTNHSYFNLNGYDGADILNTVLQIFADSYSPVDSKLIPLGPPVSVKNTVFDFTQGKPIGRDIGQSDPQLQLCGCFDHNFIISGQGERLAATAISPITGIRMSCYTDQPCVQLYTSGGLEDTAGKGGIPLHRYQGFCLETQHFPDSPNHPDYPTTLLEHGVPFESTTRYVFSSTEPKDKMTGVPR